MTQDDERGRRSRDHRGDLPRRIAARLRDVDPPAAGLRACRGGAARCVHARRWSHGRGRGFPSNPRAWLVSAGRFKAMDQHPPPAAFRRALTDELARRARPGIGRPGSARRGRTRGRPAAADLHVLPPGARAGRAGCADPAGGLRAHYGGDRACLPGRRLHASRNASCAPSRRSAMHAFRIVCRNAPSSARAWKTYCE